MCVFPVGVTSLPCWGGSLGNRELPSAALPVGAAQGSVCPSVRPTPSHAAQWHSALGSAPVRGMAWARPRACTTCALRLRCHQHRLSVAPLAGGSLSHRRVLSLCWGRVCKPLQAQAGPRCLHAACLLPVHHCLSPHTCAWSRAAPPRRGPADPPASHMRPLCNRMQKNAFKFPFNSSCKSYFMLKLKTHLLLS